MNLLIERIERVALVTLNRPEALNALNSAMLDEFIACLPALDRDPDVGCIIITGSEKAFAAGADIKEMATHSYQSMLEADYFAAWEIFAKLRTPRIAAVSGYALGGGCELAMMCDMIIAADNAKFGQPEIKLGVIPGIGGTQRLTRLIGKAKAADMILTGRLMDAQEAERSGLVARVFPAAQLLEKTLEIARTIASYSKPVTQVAKECIDRAQELGLNEGLLYERRNFHALFALDDQKEGMQAFIEKRPAQFRHR